LPVSSRRCEGQTSQNDQRLADLRYPSGAECACGALEGGIRPTRCRGAAPVTSSCWVGEVVSKVVVLFFTDFFDGGMTQADSSEDRIESLQSCTRVSREARAPSEIYPIKARATTTRRRHTFIARVIPWPPALTEEPGCAGRRTGNERGRGSWMKTTFLGDVLTCWSPPARPAPANTLSFVPRPRDRVWIGGPARRNQRRSTGEMALRRTDAHRTRRRLRLVRH